MTQQIPLPISAVRKPLSSRGKQTPRVRHAAPAWPCQRRAAQVQARQARPEKGTSAMAATTP
ncbi:hypothetical protein FHT03_000055 [Xanthomonas arboricola]|nr:hypothetical protein [Xanthomonas cannabis]